MTQPTATHPAASDLLDAARRDAAELYRFLVGVLGRVELRDQGPPAVLRSRLARRTLAEGPALAARMVGWHGELGLVLAAGRAEGSAQEIAEFLSASRVLVDQCVLIVCAAQQHSTAGLPLIHPEHLALLEPTIGVK